MFKELIAQVCFGSLLASGFIALSWLFRRQGAPTRHGLLLASILSIGLPFQLLASIGEQLRRDLPFSAVPAVLRASSSSVPTGKFGIGSAITPDYWQAFVASFLGLWLFVAAALLLKWLRRLIQPVPPYEQASKEYLELLAAAAKRLNFHQKVGLALAGGSSEPCLTGFFRPVLVLPKSIEATLSRDERLAVVLHELAHAKRLDNLWTACSQVIACAFWFNPLVWWLLRRLSLEAELACDELVLQAGIEPEIYIGVIVTICQQYLLQPISGRSNMSSSNLKNRLEHIMTLSTIGRRSITAKLCGCLLLIAAVTVSTTAGFATTTTQKPAPIVHNGPECQAAGKSFPQGTVIRFKGQSMLQRCGTEAGIPKWFRTNADHVGSAKIITLHPTPPPPVTACRQTAPQGKFCTCDHRKFSPGAVVDSTAGALVCPASGGRWQPYKGPTKPWPPAPIAN